MLIQKMIIVGTKWPVIIHVPVIDRSVVYITLTRILLKPLVFVNKLSVFQIHILLPLYLKEMLKLEVNYICDH